MHRDDTQLTATQLSEDSISTSSARAPIKSAEGASAKRLRSVHQRQPIEASALPSALLKMQTINAVTGLSAATVYRKVATGEFPKPIKLGARCTRWQAQGVREWLDAQGKTALTTAK